MNKYILSRLFGLLKPQWKVMGIAFVSALVLVIMTLLIPIFTGNAIDMMLGKGLVNFNEIIHQCFGIAVLTGFVVVAQWVLTRSLNKLSYTTIEMFRVQAIETIEQMPLSQMDQMKQGDFIARVITDVELISEGLIQGLPQLFTGVLTIVGTLLFMVSINAGLTLAVVALTPISMIVATTIAKKTYKRFKEQANIRGELTAYLSEYISNPLLVRLFAYQEKTQATFETMNQALYTSGQKAQFYSSTTNPSTRLINNILYTLMVVIGAYIALSGHISVGALSAFLIYSTQYMKPFNEISGVVSELQSAIASAQRVFVLIDAKRESLEPETMEDLQAVRGDIEIKDISFSYTKKPFIEHFNLSIQSGETIAIVGPTGCGKTTLINLVLRFYDIQQGKILVDGKDISQVTRQSLRKSIGMVLQDSWLFSGTIRENIAYGQADASIEAVVEVAKKARIHDFIIRLKDGYDTVVSEEDAQISQGQKQLICLARILLSNPPMLILDEATSNIDTRTELLIQKTIDDMMKEKTSIVIAHRLSTIENADKIVVMKDGAIIEMGNHQELLEQKGFYSTLYYSQFAKTN